MTAQVKISIRVPVKVTQKGKWFLASCPILDVHSQGQSGSKAKKALQEAIALFLRSCIERGTLDAVLKQCGFRLYSKDSGAKRPVVPKDDYINIPIALLANQDSPHACHA